ncbi:MAG: nucleotide pyrophosphohydrolase [Bdellovibrionales bacterium]|nr:nucleotide pyrophosphohydrolase [Bdellovibrionales bacterium]NQZ18422.1 nucleotide pyrophosphohydrolase [Bdellovibrionales bacterium]
METTNSLNFKDSESTIADFKKVIQEFCEERGWDPFHGAKELAIGAVTEASELLEHFRFQSTVQIEEMFQDEAKKSEIADELVDVLFFILRMSQRYDIDLGSHFNKKMEKNAKRYPAEEFKGKNHKAD